VAKTRGRPVENKVVGIRIDDPAPDFARIAQGFGIHAEARLTPRRPSDQLCDAPSAS